MARFGKPEIFSSMDGKGAWPDTVFIERLWRSIKYEEIYLHAYSSGLSNLLAGNWDLA